MPPPHWMRPCGNASAKRDTTTAKGFPPQRKAAVERRPSEHEPRMPRNHGHARLLFSIPAVPRHGIPATLRRNRRADKRARPCRKGCLRGRTTPSSRAAPRSVLCGKYSSTCRRVLVRSPQGTIRRSASRSSGFCMHGHAGMPQRNKTWALKGGLDIHTKIRYARSAITFLGPLSCLFRTTTVQRPSQWYATLRVWSPTLTIYSPFTGKRNIKSPVKRSFTKNIRPSAP